MRKKGLKLANPNHSELKGWSKASLLDFTEFIKANKPKSFKKHLEEFEELKRGN